MKTTASKRTTAGKRNATTLIATGGTAPAPRRRFMQAVLSAPVLAVTATAAQSAPVAAAAAGPVAKPSGYHETDHIRRYYALANY